MNWIRGIPFSICLVIKTELTHFWAPDWLNVKDFEVQKGQQSLKDELFAIHMHRLLIQ